MPALSFGNGKNQIKGKIIAFLKNVQNRVSGTLENQRFLKSETFLIGNAHHMDEEVTAIVLFKRFLVFFRQILWPCKQRQHLFSQFSFKLFIKD